VNLLNFTVPSSAGVNSISSPFTVILLTLYPTFGLIIISFLFVPPLSTVSYISSFSPLIFPPSPFTSVVILYVVPIRPALTLSTVAFIITVLLSLIISSVSFVETLNLLFTSWLSPTFFSVK